jgi:hypothetical protein
MRAGKNCLKSRVIIPSEEKLENSTLWFRQSEPLDIVGLEPGAADKN